MLALKISVVGLLRYAITPEGTKALIEWLPQVLCDLTLWSLPGVLHHRTHFFNFFELLYFQFTSLKPSPLYLFTHHPNALDPSYRESP